MDEPMLIRCARCSALVAVQDAARCGHHETDPLCGFCWTDHVSRSLEGETGLGGWGRCWAEVGRVDWR